jgi:hypothetical protein
LSGIAGAEDASMRAAGAGQERARSPADAEGVLPNTVAEAAFQEAVEIADVEAFEEVEGLQRIAATFARIA